MEGKSRVIPKIFLCGIRTPGNFRQWNPESWALESEIEAKDSRMPLTIGIRNLSSTDKKSRVDSSFQLIYHDPSDFGSLIPTRIISKERSPTLSWITDPRLRCLGSAMTLNEIQGLFPGGGGLPYESGGDARCLA